MGYAERSQGLRGPEIQVGGDGHGIATPQLLEPGL
jgi:hypothetical protein